MEYLYANDPPTLYPHKSYIPTLSPLTNEWKFPFALYHVNPNLSSLELKLNQNHQEHWTMCRVINLKTGCSDMLYSRPHSTSTSTHASHILCQYSVLYVFYGFLVLNRNFRPTDHLMILILKSHIIVIQYM